MNFSAVILAGGKSSRMGRDKAFLEFEGQTLLSRQIQLARETGSKEIFISGRADTNYSAFGCRVLTDKFRNAGPLAGIERALEACSSPLVLVLAVDMPNLNAGLLRRLASHCAENAGAIFRTGGDFEPLAAIYSKAARPLAAALLNEHSNAVKHFAERCIEADLASFVDLAPRDARFFANWNSRADPNGCMI